MEMTEDIRERFYRLSETHNESITLTTNFNITLKELINNALAAHDDYTKAKVLLNDTECSEQNKEKLMNILDKIQKLTIDARKELVDAYKVLLKDEE